MTYRVKKSALGVMLQYLGLKLKDLEIVEDGEWVTVRKKSECF